MSERQGNSERGGRGGRGNRGRRGGSRGGARGGRNNGNRNGNNNRNRNGNRKNHPNSGKAQFMEVQKLIHNVRPVTVNGVATESIEGDLDEYVKKILDDPKNEENLYLSFLMHPTDPDFPYDLDFLKFTLSLPRSYPKHAPSPTIMVLNDDIPRGFSVNIELGFKEIVSAALSNREQKGKKQSKNDEEEEGLDIKMVGGNDLLGMIQTLDKYLEKFLSMEKKDTIKIVKVIQKRDEERERKKLEEKKMRDEERQKKIEQQKKRQRELLNLDPAILEKRQAEIDRLQQRLEKNRLRLFKESNQNTTFKLELPFQDESFTIDIEDATEIELKKLPVRLSIPMEYLSNPKKPLKMDIDMSSDYNLKLMKSLEDPGTRLIFGKLISNMNGNFTYFSAEAAKKNCEASEAVETDSAEPFWSITSQLNFFVENIQKFMSLKPDFVKWYTTNEELNEELLTES